MFSKHFIRATLVTTALVAVPAAWAADQTTTTTGTMAPNSTMAPNTTMAPNNAMAPKGAMTPSPNGSMAPAADSGAMTPAATTGDTAPATGANSFTEGEAKARIERSGFNDVSALKQDDKGVWRGTASKDGKSMPVALDFKGDIVGQ